jgi:hypothetical protein
VKKKPEHPLSLAASQYTGFTARQTANIFATNAGYVGGFQWDGSFIDQVLLDAETASALPRHSNTTTALGFYLLNGWQRRAPKPGDLVFYNYTTASQTVSFDSPHIGVVTDTDRWKKEHLFQAIEGQVSSGQPKAAQEDNGVYKRTRYATDVLTFVRIPNRYLQQDTKQLELLTPELTHIVRPGHIERCSTKQAPTAKPEFRKSTELVQLALAAHPGVRLQNADRGVYNGKTQTAIALFQRLNGFPAAECSGLPTLRTLKLLSVYGNFQVDN